MTLFIIGKAWLFAVVVGLLFLYPRGSRFLSAHWLLGSTLGMVLSFVGLAIASRSLDAANWMPVAMAVGAVFGALIGSRLAFKLNVALGWQTPK
jgi:uncharacterized protein YybS (DUF2232 family)